MIDRNYGVALDVGTLLKKEEEKEHKKRAEAVVDDEKKPEPAVQPKNQKDSWFDKNRLRIFIVLLVCFSAMVLAQPAFLSNIEMNVRNSLTEQYRQSALIDINKNFPSASEAQKRSLADKKIAPLVQSPEFDARVQETAEQFKSYYRDDKGQTYLYSADPYYFFRLARNLVEYGMLGDKSVQDPSGAGMIVQDSLRFFPHSDFPAFSVFPYLLFYFFKVSKLFSPSISLLTTSFYVPVVVGVISVMLIFLIARMGGNDGAGLLTAFLFLVHPVFLFWNYAGYTDTQIIALLWCLLSIFLFLCVLDWSHAKRAIGALIGLGLVLYYSKEVWQGLFFVPVLFIAFFALWCGVSILRKAFVDKKKVWLLFFVVILAGGAVGVWYLGSDYWERALSFLRVGTEARLFPTAFSSITELQGALTLQRFIVALGGGLVLTVFMIEIFATVKSLVKKTDKNTLFHMVWFLVIVIPAFVSARFLFFVLPPFVIIAGRGFSRIAGWIETFCRSVLRLRMGNFSLRIMSMVIMFVIIMFAVNASPLVLKTKVPLMSKSVADAAEYIKTRSTNDAVIATWWDLGYAWETFARRATFFDGGLFTTPRLYFMAKALSTENENVSKNILQILSCGTDSYVVINSFDVWAKTQPEKIALFEKSLSLSTEQARKSVSQLGGDAHNTYCNKTTSVYFVVTENMLYQMHLFDHYAAWDFRAASIRQSIAGLPEGVAIARLQRDYNMSEDDARAAFDETKSFVDTVAPKAIGEISSCTKVNQKLQCANGFTVDMLSLNATENGGHPESLIFVKDGKKVVVRYKDSPVNFSIVVYSLGNDVYRSVLMDTSLTKKMVVRMFLGEKFDNFEQVFASDETPQRVVVYKMKQPTLLNSKVPA